MDSFSLKDKVVVVTGGTGILGGSFVLAIARAGASVVIIGRNKERLDQKKSEVEALGGQALAIQADVMEQSALIAARDQILASFGRIDGLVNAAGGNVPEALLQPDQDIFDLNIEGTKKALELNLWGSIVPTHILGASMRETGGSIVNISSVSSKKVLTRVLGYSMGKAAIDKYTEWLGVEAATRHAGKIRVNSITPGFFLTEQNRRMLTNEDGSLTERGEKIIKATPYGRFGKPEELNGALIYLLSDASKFVTGITVTVDGGYTVYGGV